MIRFDKGSFPAKPLSIMPVIVSCCSVADHDWQRSTDYPSASALLAFLEADLDRGLRLARQATLEWEAARQIAPKLLAELEVVNLEILRWLDRARQRNLHTGRLRLGVDQFGIALAQVRRLAGGAERGEG